jgi:hypothetical protein
LTETADLQFERAQFDDAPTRPACLMCDAPLFGSYFEVNGQTVCEKCTFLLKDAENQGSGAGRALRATGAGLGAAIAGCVLYWAILAMSGYEFALIAIVVGFLVGKAVHWGSHGKGGWRYQTLAVVLTYLAIVGSYIPLMVAEILKQPTEQSEAAQGGQAEAATAETVTPSAAGEAAPAPGSLLLALGVLLGIALAAPFLGGVENLLGIIIIGVGLYEAWKLNRHQPVVITGPHVLASTGTAAAAQ